MADDAPASAVAPSSGTRPPLPAALTSRSLGVERGQTLPPVPRERVHWVSDAAGVAAMRAATLDPARNPSTREGYPPLVGLDGEWKPGSRTPVSILQVATRSDAFVVDLFAVADPTSAACAPFDAFLAELFESEAVVKLGFSFGYDLSRMRVSYPHLAALRSKRDPRFLIDVKQLAHVASANRTNLRVGLATLTRLVLGANLSKAEQCSDWSRRPLAEAQLAYAAADAFYLCLIFDKCVRKSNDTLLAKLSDIALVGDPRAKGKHLPRKAKKALKKQAALASRLSARAGGPGFGATRREADVVDVTVDVPALLASVGASVPGGGRKGALKLLANGRDARAPKGGAVERWANAVALYLTVGDPARRGGGDAEKKTLAFWNEPAGTDAAEDAAGAAAGPGRRHPRILTRIDPTVAAGGADAALVAAFAAACRPAAGSDDDARARVEKVPCDDPERDDAREGCEVEVEVDAGETTALLFMRRPPGGYVFCGRLEEVRGVGIDAGGGDEAPTLALLDADALRGASTFHQLVGCRLAEGPPGRTSAE